MSNKRPGICHNPNCGKRRGMVSRFWFNHAFCSNKCKWSFIADRLKTSVDMVQRMFSTVGR